MKIILDIKDEKASFMMEVLKNFKDVKVKSLTNYKADVLEGIKEGIEEVKLIKQGKLKGIPEKELFTVDEARIYSKNLIGKLASEKKLV